MYKRIFDIENKLDEGMFLFGARQTGKSTLLKERFKITCLATHNYWYD